MRKFTIILVASFIAIQAFSVDIIGNFSLSSYGKYYPYFANGTMHVNFDFQVTDGPIITPFKIGFYISTDLIITTSDFKFHEFTINSCNNGSSAFPDQFGSAAPYKIEQMLTIGGIPKNQVVFLGVLLDYANAISETDESNNGGPVNMAPFQITGTVGLDISIKPVIMTITPNPINTEAILQISNLKGSEATLKVLDITGRVVASTIITGSEILWSRGSLHAGIYLMIIEQNGQAVLRKKVIIQ